MCIAYVYFIYNSAEKAARMLSLLLVSSSLKIVNYHWVPNSGYLSSYRLSESCVAISPPLSVS